MPRKTATVPTDSSSGGPEKERYELRKVEDVTSFSLDDRKRRLRQTRVYYPRFRSAMDLIRRAHESALRGGPPACAYISGPPGIGKTEVYLTYMQAHQPRRTEEGMVVPILPFFLPAQAAPRSVAMAMLKTLGDPNFERGTTAGMSSRVVHFLRECKVQLVILDEFHHFLDRQTHRVLVAVSEWLKTLIISTGVPVAAFGMHSGERVLDYRTDPTEDESQLGSRFPFRYRLAPFSWSSKKETNEYQMFLQRLDDAMPLAKRSDLDDPDVALRLNYATGGLVRPLIDLLELALDLAVNGGCERIEMKHLRKAYVECIQPGHKERRNPFAVPTFTTDTANKWRLEEKKRLRAGSDRPRKGEDPSLGDVLQT